MGSPTGRVTAAASSTSQMPPRSPGPERGPAHAAAALLHSPGLRTAAGCRGRGNWVQIHLGSSGTPAPPPPVSVDEPSAPRPGETGGLFPKETEQRRQTKPCGRVGGGRGNLHTNRRPPPQPRRQSPPRGKCRKERWLAGWPQTQEVGPGRAACYSPARDRPLSLTPGSLRHRGPTAEPVNGAIRGDSARKAQAAVPIPEPRTGCCFQRKHGRQRRASEMRTPLKT